MKKLTLEDLSGRLFEVERALAWSMSANNSLRVACFHEMDCVRHSIKRLEREVSLMAKKKSGKKVKGTNKGC